MGAWATRAAWVDSAAFNSIDTVLQLQLQSVVVAVLNGCCNTRTFTCIDTVNFKNDRRSSGGTLRQKFNHIDIWLLTFDSWLLTFDTSHVTCDIWHMTYDMWHLTFNQWTKGPMDQWSTGPIDQSTNGQKWQRYWLKKLLWPYEKKKHLRKAWMLKISKSVRWIYTSTSCRS